MFELMEEEQMDVTERGHAPMHFRSKQTNTTLSTLCCSCSLTLRERERDREREQVNEREREFHSD